MDYFLTYIVKINFLKMHLSDSWARFIYICGLFLNHRCLRNNEFERHSHRYSAPLLQIMLKKAEIGDSACMGRIACQDVQVMRKALF